MATLSHYDVIVVGGGTAGCSAAFIAGKLGLKTLLIEKNIHLGGTITSGRVIPAMNSSKKQINTDFFNALIKELKKLKGQTTYQDNPGWFNPELCKIALDRLMTKAKVEVLFDTKVTGVNIINREINGVTTCSNMLSVYIGTKYIIDTTGNCDLAALAGCNFLQKENNTDGEFQPVSLRFEMSGVDIETFSKWLLDFDKDRKVTTVQAIDGQTHLSTAYTWDKEPKNAITWALTPLFDHAVKEKVLKTNDRNYFQIFTIPGMPNSVSFNCPRMVYDKEINPLASEQVSNVLTDARESIYRLSNFCKIYLPGFEISYISNIADALGVRVSRRIKGKYVYTVQDLKSGKRFDTPVLVGNYPIDIHSGKQNKSVLENTNQDYYLPIEALISADYDNLFVAGRCLSADFYAQAALRIQPSCFSMGEGVAKYIAKLIK